MAISTAQYQAMRAQLRAALCGSGDYNAALANPSDLDLNSVFNQLITDSSGASIAANVATACASAARSRMGGALASALNPSDQDVLDFFAQLKTDSSGAAAPNAARYAFMKDLLRAMLTNNTPGVRNPSIADMLGYIASVAGSGGPTGTDFAALAVANSLTVVGYYRGDYGLSGSSGTGFASWANISGAMSAITPHGSATNGIGAAGTGLGGRASLKQNGATQKGLFTAPALSAPATTNIHKYWIAMQATGGSSSARGILQDGGVTDTYLSTSVLVNVLATGSVTANISNDIFQRSRISWTGGANCELKVGNNTAVTGTGTDTAPATARTFGDLLLNWEWLMYIEVTGTKANFLTFATAADSAAQTTWTNAIQI